MSAKNARFARRKIRADVVEEPLVYAPKCWTGGARPVRDLGLLDSACHRPQAGLLGQDAYPTLAGKASALMHSLAGSHALVDGNKRLALLATAVFPRINGYRLDMTDDEAFDLTVSVAAGELDAAGIEKRLRLIVVSDDA